jgi:serine/threonine protein kinase/Flp pilus assembly protein TadD
MAARHPESERIADIQPAAPTDGSSLLLEPSGSLATQQVIELVAAWRRGERPVAEDFLAAHPELGEDAAIRLIYEEVCLRREVGLEVDHEEILQRFPDCRQELEALLECQSLIDQAPGSRAEFPEEGEVLAGFRLERELGRGSAGRVFLAVQPSLADRPVVLKVTPRGREEHLSLARLQHTNIVPLYSEHMLQARGLQILCMPYLGGATLARALLLVKAKPETERSGKHLLAAIDRIQDELPGSHQTTGPLRQFIARASYIEAICLIGACLADGLQYAHDRELLHMDVKPSNVLLAGDGQPMLLDFHLARGPIAPGESPPAWAGGTPGYMSPEQWGVITAVREGRPVTAAVDRRTDIYSLGALLYEALGGQLATSPGAVPAPLRNFNPRVSPGLADIIQKCLQGDARARYSDASALANDLRRHLNHLPLRGVHNRSLRERWRKWRLRQPVALLRSIVLLFLAGSSLLAAGSLAIAYRARIREIDDALAQGRKFLDRRQFAEASDFLNRGLSLAEPLPGSSRRRTSLAVLLARAARGSKREELHQLAELIRFRYGLALPPREEGLSLMRLGRAVWEGRHRLLEPLAGDDATGAADRTRTDLLDLVVLWANLRGHVAPASDALLAKREALALLTNAKALLGNSPSLERDRRALAHALGLQNVAPDAALEAHSAWERFDLGKSYLKTGEIERASHEFRVGLEERPQDFWLNFYEGLCAYRLERFEEAVGAFRVAIALAPEAAECRYNRALAYQSLDRFDLALADYSRALELNPRFTDAAINRGVLLNRLGRHDDARVDLRRALASASSRETRGAVHYNLALVDLATGQRESCAEHAQAALGLGNPDARELLGRLHR